MKKNFKAGSKVNLLTKDSRDFSGIILPDSDSKKVVLKLSSGYNIGLLKSNIASVKVVSQQKKESSSISRLSLSQKTSKNLPTISIIHTGGTINSKVDYETGAVIARFTPEELLAMFPEIKNLCNIRSYLLANMFSEDMRFSHYNEMAKAIKKEAANGSDGVIITHGTDTLAYSSTALSFILEDLNIPVLFVGAQRSSDRGSSDAFLNLFCAVQFITKSNFCDIGICMHEHSDDRSCLIFPATKTRKLHTSRRDAFRAVNSRPIARVFSDGRCENISKFPTRENRKNLAIKIKSIKENLKIGILKVHPNLYAKEIQSYSSFDGLIIEGTGLGHVSINKIDSKTTENKNVHSALKSLAKKIPVFMASQCIHGSINMNVYSTGRRLKDIGILGDYNDMLAETAFIKMAWLLSNYPKKEVGKLMMENMHGEINLRSINEEIPHDL